MTPEDTFFLFMALLITVEVIADVIEWWRDL